jgi:hypothetical protein
MSDEEMKPTFPFTYELEFPFEVDGKQKTEITFTRFPKAIHGLPIIPKDIKQDHYIPALMSMSGEPLLVFTEMCQADLRRALVLCSDFF